MSLDVSGLTNMYTTGTNATSSANASKLNGTVNGLNEDSTDEELMSAIKDFESYFVEKILSEVKDTFTTFGEDDDEDSAMGKLTDMYMDSVYEELADALTEDVGSSFTQQLYEQMKRNYNME